MSIEVAPGTRVAVAGGPHSGTSAILAELAASSPATTRLWLTPALPGVGLPTSVSLDALARARSFANAGAVRGIPALVEHTAAELGMTGGFGGRSDLPLRRLRPEELLRAAVVYARIAEPELLLVDGWPFGQDAVADAALFALAQMRRTEGRTTVLSTDRPDIVTGTTDLVTIVDEGSLIDARTGPEWRSFAAGLRVGAPADPAAAARGIVEHGGTNTWLGSGGVLYTEQAYADNSFRRPTMIEVFNEVVLGHRRVPTPERTPAPELHLAAAPDGPPATPPAARSVGALAWLAIGARGPWLIALLTWLVAVVGAGAGAHRFAIAVFAVGAAAMAVTAARRVDRNGLRFQAALAPGAAAFAGRARLAAAVVGAALTVPGAVLVAAVRKLGNHAAVSSVLIEGVVSVALAAGVAAGILWATWAFTDRKQSAADGAPGRAA